jgi:hypothetical protein
MKRSLEEEESGKKFGEESQQRSSWTEQEDQKLLELGNKYKGKHWKSISDAVSSVSPQGSKGKSAKQCRERWHIHLNPSINAGKWTMEDETSLFALHQEIGSKWSIIAQKLPGRTDNAVKNFFFCKLRRLVRNIKDGISDINANSAHYEVFHCIYLMNFLFLYYLSPDRDTNIVKSLTSQIKGRQNKGDKYILDMLSQKSISMPNFARYLKMILTMLPNNLSRTALQPYENLTNLLSSDSEESLSKGCSNSSLNQYPSSGISKDSSTGSGKISA